MSELDIFKGSRVLVTGHTGFKGSWLSFWLELLGAQVYGLSLDVPTSPSHFEHLVPWFFGRFGVVVSKDNRIRRI